MSELDSKYKKNDFKLPENYIQGMEMKVLDKIKASQKPRIYFFNKPAFRYSSIAAILSIFIYFNLPKKPVSTETPEISFNNIDTIELLAFENNVELSDEEFESWIPNYAIDSIYKEEIVLVNTKEYQIEEDIYSDIEEEFNLLDNL